MHSEHTLVQQAEYMLCFLVMCSCTTNTKIKIHSKGVMQLLPVNFTVSACVQTGLLAAWTSCAQKVLFGFSEYGQGVWLTLVLLGTHVYSPVLLLLWPESVHYL